MIHVICIKFGTKYSSEYVNKLFRGIKRNTSKSFLFTCFTDNSVGINESIDIKPLPFNVGDWHNKIGLYNKNLYNESNQIFYFDLDTVITGNLDEIFEYSGDFIILRDFYRSDGFGSGLMSWRPASVHFMYEKFTRNTKCRHGDQGWCEKMYPKADIWQKEYPKKIISYKVHIVGKGVPRAKSFTNEPGNLKTASIVCFHGRPSPHDLEPKKLDWMEKHWK